MFLLRVVELNKNLCTERAMDDGDVSITDLYLSLPNNNILLYNIKVRMTSALLFRPS
jgi:hypothetical protein